MSVNPQAVSSQTLRKKARHLARVAPPALAMLVVGVVATYQLALPSASAAQPAEPAPIERLGTLLEVGYDTDTLLAGGLAPAGVRGFYEAGMLETTAIDAVSAALVNLKDERSALREIEAEIRRLGLDDVRDTDRASSRTAVEAAEDALVAAEAALASAISDRLDGQVDQGVLDEIALVATRRGWAVPAAWRLRDFVDDDAVKDAERLAAKVRTDPDADLSADQAGLLAAITGDADVSAAGFRVESGSQVTQQSFMQYVTDLQSGE